MTALIAVATQELTSVEKTGLLGLAGFGCYLPFVIRDWYRDRSRR